jgi:2'-5' RNA ligase
LAAALMVRGRLADEINGLRRALASAEIDRIAPHVTLVPPVNVTDADVPTACELLRSVAAGFGPLALDLGPPRSFLQPSRTVSGRGLLPRRPSAGSGHSCRI